MRTSVRVALVTIALGLSVLFSGLAPAYAAAVFVETNPSTAPAGDEIGLRASCTDNLQDATVSAEPFGTVTVKPSFGFLTATTRVPATTRPGDYQVTLRCPDGQTATSVLHVVAQVAPARGPATGGGGTAPGRTAPIWIGGGLAAIAAGLVLAVVSVRRRRFG
jgi:hypothetical protein